MCVGVCGCVCVCVCVCVAKTAFSITPSKNVGGIFQDFI